MYAFVLFFHFIQLCIPFTQPRLWWGYRANNMLYHWIIFLFAFQMNRLVAKVSIFMYSYFLIHKFGRMWVLLGMQGVYLLNIFYPTTRLPYQPVSIHIGKINNCRKQDLSIDKSGKHLLLAFTITLRIHGVQNTCYFVWLWTCVILDKTWLSFAFSYNDLIYYIDGTLIFL